VLRPLAQEIISVFGKWGIAANGFGLAAVADLPLRNCPTQQR